MPRITFFANRLIHPGEELCISYVDAPDGEEEGSDVQYRECRCNSARCKGAAANDTRREVKAHSEQVDFPYDLEASAKPEDAAPCRVVHHYSSFAYVIVDILMDGVL